MIKMEKRKKPSIPGLQRSEDIEAVPAGYSEKALPASANVDPRDTRLLEDGLPDVTVKMEKEDGGPWIPNQQGFEESKASGFPKERTKVKDEEELWDHQAVEGNNIFPTTCSGFPGVKPYLVFQHQQGERPWMREQKVSGKNELPDHSSGFPVVAIKVEEPWDQKGLEEVEDIQVPCSEFTVVKVKVEEEEEEEEEEPLVSDLQDYEEEFAVVKVKVEEEEEEEDPLVSDIQNHEEVTLRTMKRISDCFTEAAKKRKVTEDCSSTLRYYSSVHPAGISSPNNNNSGLGLKNATSYLGSSTLLPEVNQNFWPSCWTVEQKREFVKKNDWLYFHGGKLGCSVCKNVGCLGIGKKAGMRLSKEWIKCTVSSYGENRKQQLTSLRKKIFDHKESAGHKAAVKIIEETKKEKLEIVCLQSLARREKEITHKIFRTAYKVAKKNQPFHNFETEIDLQELNGIDMGRILRSVDACINIINHIGSEMRTILTRKIIDSKSKFSLILDESTTMSQKPVLMVYIRTYIEETDMQEPVNLFTGLIELEDVTANGIFKSLMSHIESLGFTEEYLKGHLVSLTCDGAAVMLGSHGGVSKLFKERFPGIVVWRCASHRLELSVHDAVKEVSGINRFKRFLDKLYVTYRASLKNARQLQTCAATLEMQILRIGRILSTKWVASSYRTVLAVWQDYEALVHHFEEGKSENGLSRKEKCTYEGLHRKITSVEFILDLGLLCDALQELSELTSDLQERNMDLYTAHSKIECLVDVCEKRSTVPGPYYKKALEATEHLQFKGVPLHTKSRIDDPPISPVAFYEHLKISVQKRLLSKEDAELSRCGRILDSKNWPANSRDNILFGVEEIYTLARRFQLNEREALQAFREHMKCRKETPKELSRIQHILNTIAISSRECERGFSQMNQIVTPERSSLSVRTITSLLFIKIVGPPLTVFDPAKYVKTWSLQDHHSTIETNSMTQKRTEEVGDMSKVWKLL